MAAREFVIFKTPTARIKIQASMSSFVEMPTLFPKVTCAGPIEHLKHPTIFAFETKSIGFVNCLGACPFSSIL